MSAKLPSVLEDTNIFFKDESWAGLANEATLPKIAVKMADQVLAGVAGTIERDLGKLEKMEAGVVVSDMSAKVIDLIGSQDSRDEVLTFRGAVNADDANRAVVVKMQGFWKEVEFNAWKPEEMMSSKFAIALEFFELSVDGVEVIYVDKLANIFRVNGKDRNQWKREALAQ
ncbi:phage major tail tube protein [Pontibacterium sp.]|jgi:P2 family phage contractile tail tube protein|uniref:phage major tail tube protein n=1 Tax=Pontibacterium sp. TaxID=2036026 RepID=UPI00356B0BE5